MQIRQHISCGTACMHSSALLQSQQRCSSHHRHHHCSSFPASWQGVLAICALVPTMMCWLLFGCKDSNLSSSQRLCFNCIEGVCNCGLCICRCGQPSDTALCLTPGGGTFACASLRRCNPSWITPGDTCACSFRMPPSQWPVG